MPNVKWKQNIYPLDKFNRCLIDCPLCHVFQYDCAYAEKSQQTITIYQAYMNLKTEVYDVVCPSCQGKFQINANQKQFDGQYETVYLSVPFVKKKRAVAQLKA